MPEHPLHAQFERAESWLFTEQKELRDAWMRGKETAESICARLSEQSGIPPHVLLKQLENDCRGLHLLPGAEEELRRIRSLGIRVILVTDNMDTFRRWTIPSQQLETVFDEIISSHEHAVRKHDVDERGEPALFARWLNTNGLKWSDAFLIDDGAEKHADMRKHGLRIAIPHSQEETLQILKSIQ